ncbi:hypothetical protein J6590_021503 [Homalodisca vitripennis]|nr:hypothetical protein J6590_021503 [Homalodisca vitripennis]
MERSGEFGIETTRTRRSHSLVMKSFGTTCVSNCVRVVRLRAQHKLDWIRQFVAKGSVGSFVNKCNVLFCTEVTDKLFDLKGDSRIKSAKSCHVRTASYCVL